MKRALPWILVWGLLAAPAPAQELPKDMVLIPAGEFMAGPPEQPSPMHLPAFFIDMHEVTQADFKRVTGGNPAFFHGPNLPVEKVTWFEAQDYCARVNKRLPTEWEWEKAAKAGTRTRYYWGNEVDGAYAWYKENADKQTHPVGQKLPNAFGLYDMAGNVWEWTSSDYSGTVPGKVKRGGSWRNTARSLFSAKRIASLLHFRYHYVGFRCARSASEGDRSSR